MKAKTIARFKRKFDRGGLYLNYIAILISGGTFLKVFEINEWWAYLLGTITVIVFRYVAGFIDDKSGILSHEQDQITRRNLEWNKMMDLLKEIDKKLKTNGDRKE